MQPERHHSPGPLRQPLVRVIATPARAIRSLRLLERFKVTDHSMAPSLIPGDRLIARLTGGTRDPRRGDIVMFRSANRYLVKRVVGLPGETVRIEGGVLLIDGDPLHEPWWNAATRPEGGWSVPTDSWFVLGDNRPASTHDSRTAGPIHREILHSIAIARYRPLTRARLLP